MNSLTIFASVFRWVEWGNQKMWPRPFSSSPPTTLATLQALRCSLMVGKPCKVGATLPPNLISWLPNKAIMEKQLTASPTNRPSIWHIVGMGFLLRLLIDTSGQMIYPFVPIFAAGLGVSAVVIGRLFSLQSFVGIFAPIFGNMADSYGYRPFMRLGLGAVGVGMIVFASSPTIVFAAIGSLIIGFGFSLFTPNLLAYLSANLPPERRSRGMGAVEFSLGFGWYRWHYTLRHRHCSLGLAWATNWFRNCAPNRQLCTSIFPRNATP